MKQHKGIDDLRKFVPIEKIQKIILRTIKNESINDELAYTQDKRLMQMFQRSPINELREEYYYLQYVNRHAKTTFNESIESLALRIFKFYSQQRTFLNLGSGLGHMLWKASDEYSFLYGEEIDENIAKISEQLLNSSNNDSKIKIQVVDSTLNLKNKDKFECVYCNILFPNIDSEYSMEDEKIESEGYFETKSNSLEWKFVNRILDSLEDTGTGIIIMRKTSITLEMSKDIRKSLVEKGLIKAVIQLPSNIAMTNKPTILLVLQKCGNNKITFIDASKIYTQKGRKQKIFEDKDIKEIMKALENESLISKKVNSQTIINNDYNLSPIHYLVDIKDYLVNPTCLTDVVETIRGKDVSKNRLDNEQNNNQVGYLLNLSDVKNYKIDIPKQKISQDILNEYRKYLLNPMDIVISTRSSELKIAFVTEDLANENIIISSNFNILRVKDYKINPYYLFAFLNSQIGIEQFEQLTTGTLINVISQKALKNYKFPMLSQSVQEDVAFKMKEKLSQYYSYLKKIQKFQRELPQFFDEITK